MARLNPPYSAAVVDVPDEQVEQYVSSGWEEVKAAKESAKTSERRTSRNK